jgi:hypothetical protein
LEKGKKPFATTFAKSNACGRKNMGPLSYLHRTLIKEPASGGSSMTHFIQL